MAGVVMTSGSICGLLTAMLLAKDGHGVTVLERNPDPAAQPMAAWDEWERQGVGPVAMVDDVVRRRFLATAVLRETPESVLADPDICERLDASDVDPEPKGGPSRQELLDLVGD